MGCLIGTVQFIFWATNFAVFLLGCICLGLASYVLAVGGEITALIDMGGEETPVIYTSGAILMIVFSLAVIIVTFLGCYGALKKSQCMLGTYFVINLIAFIMVLVAALIGYVQGLAFIPEQLIVTQKTYGKNGTTNDAITEAWNLVQQEFDCCGVYNYSDWKQAQDDGAQFYADEQRSVKCEPKSSPKCVVPYICCSDQPGPTEIKSCQKDPSDSDVEHLGRLKQGCWEEFDALIDKNQAYILGAGLATVFLMIANIVIAFCLCKMSGDD